MFTTFPKPYTLNTAPGRWVGVQGTPPGGGGGGWNKRQASCFMAVSYTHLTLPTNREV